MTLSACTTLPRVPDDTTQSGSGGVGDTPSTPTKTAKQAIEEYLSSIENNFSASGEIKNNLGELLTGGDKYAIMVDGNNIYTDNDGQKYYVEKAGETEYVYLKQDSAWHKREITEDDNYPSNMSILTDLLDKVTWTKYNATTNYAEGKFKHKSNDMWIECTMGASKAKVSLYKINHGIFRDTLISVGGIEIYDIGTTVVNLPTTFVDDTAQATTANR